jgi:hypothetical protein
MSPSGWLPASDSRLLWRGAAACALTLISSICSPLSAATNGAMMAGPFASSELRIANMASADSGLARKDDSKGETVLEPCGGMAAHVSELTVGIMLPTGVLPQNVAAQCAATSPPTEDRRRIGPWTLTEYHWYASCLRHRPLYFEDIGLERYGHATCRGLQPLVSALRFFTSAAALPYKMTLEHSHSCIYALGHPRPGDCTPRYYWRPPLRISPGLIEAGTVVGLIFLLP